MNFYKDVKGYRAYVLNGTGEASEPVHFHIKKGSSPNDCAKFWLSFDQSRVIIEHNKGKIPANVWQEIIDNVLQNELQTLLAFWANLKNVSVVQLDYYDQYGYVMSKEYYPNL